MTDFAIPVSKWKSLTKEEALAQDWDQVPALTSFAKTQEFCDGIERQQTQLRASVALHLGIAISEVVLVERKHWLWGSFNLILPVDIERTRYTPTIPRQLILRFPLPFRCGEEFSPGNVEEKLRCEAATYIWLQKFCPSVPTPRLLGFGLPDGQIFTAIENQSLWHRLVWQVRNFWSWLRGEVLAPFSRCNRDKGQFGSGYFLLEHALLKGEPLSSSFTENRKDDFRRQKLFRGIAGIMLDLSKIPLPRIGSWTINNRGVLSLTNRPLLDLTMLWNRHEIPCNIPRDLTYSSSESFVQDLLEYHDLRLQHQQNAILSKNDGIFQLATLTALRALLPKFWGKDSRHAPFVLTLPDLHSSNIFVDDAWNIVSVLDLEFAPVQPQCMVGVPTWLSDKSIDELDGPALDEFHDVYNEFVRALEVEEKVRGLQHGFSERLREDWQTGRLWYNAALCSSNGFPIIFETNLQPRYLPSMDHDKQEGLPLARLWGEHMEDFILAKLEDNERYKERVSAIFEEAETTQRMKAADADQWDTESQKSVTAE